MWKVVRNPAGDITNLYYNFTVVKQLVGMKVPNGMMQYYVEKNFPFTLNIHKKMYIRLKDQFHQNAFSEINNPNSKLRTYGLIKDTIGTEYHLKSIRNTKYRIFLTKLRLSDHKLMIEAGRHQKLAKLQRFCPFCPQTVEDEKHFLITCAHYSVLRKPLFEKCAYLKPNFIHYNETEKFIFIMTCKEISQNVGKFVSEAMGERNKDIM